MARPAQRALWGWGGATLLILALVAAAPALSRHDPNRLEHRARAPAAVGRHWFGTDEAGRDILSRVLHGGRESITAALVVILAAAFCIGIVVGATGGLGRGCVDEVLMRDDRPVLRVPAAGAGDGDHGRARAEPPRTR